MNNIYQVEIENLTKYFGSNLALDKLNLKIKKGELYGLVGPDGAGKTTIMRILAGIMPFSSGETKLLGFSISKEFEKINEKIGYMSQRFGLYEDLTVLENINFYADIFNVSMKEREKKIEELLEFSNLKPFKKRLAGKLSGGMKQKLGLICALIHKPEILLLDEPTNGVDPISRRDFWKILYNLLKENVTILISTSYLDEAERCTRIGLIYKGRIIEEANPKELKSSFEFFGFEIILDDPRYVGNLLKDIDLIKSMSIYGDRIHLFFKEKKDLSAVLEELKLKKIEFKEYKEITPSIEDIFIFKVRQYEKQ